MENLAIGMKTGMYNAVHVEVQVVELIAIRVWSGNVDR